MDEETSTATAVVDDATSAPLPPRPRLAPLPRDRYIDREL